MRITQVGSRSHETLRQARRRLFQWLGHRTAWVPFRTFESLFGRVPEILGQCFLLGAIWWEANFGVGGGKIIQSIGSEGLNRTHWNAGCAQLISLGPLSCLLRRRTDLIPVIEIFLKIGSRVVMYACLFAYVALFKCMYIYTYLGGRGGGPGFLAKRVAPGHPLASADSQAAGTCRWAPRRPERGRPDGSRGKSEGSRSEYSHISLFGGFKF